MQRDRARERARFDRDSELPGYDRGLHGGGVLGRP